MKTVVKELAYEDVLKIQEKGKTSKLDKPVKPALFWRTLIKLIAKPDLKKTNFTYKTFGMEKLGKNEPCLILMNHSSFIDLEIVESIFYPRPMNIICTSDGFVGKNLLMKNIGCIPTNKFVADFVMVKNMKFALEKLKSSVLMYPEASYSFDGTATPLPETLGKCLKLLNVPVVMVRTYGAFARDPLYNNLQVRNVNVSADVKYLLSPSEIQEKSINELNDILKKEFTFDNWKWQQDNNVIINEPFRADYLNRILYKCCNCGKEGLMEGKGIHLTCGNCNSKWELTENGKLSRVNNTDNNSDEKTVTEIPQSEEFDFTHIPSWYQWERQEVRKEIENQSYEINCDVDICMMVDKKAIYKVGQGKLTHNHNGFVLDGCDGKLHYEQKPKSSYSLYSDYFWYEIGDMICIGDMKTLYYCFPKNSGDIVTKARIATEEMFKLVTKK